MLALPVTGFAEEKINNVTVRLETEGFDKWGSPEIEVVTRSGHYSAGEIYTAFDYYGMDGTYDEDSNVYVIQLDAEDGYYFNITKVENIKVTGLGATYVKASRQNNGQNLYITVSLDIDTFVGEIEDAKWTQNGFGTWDEAYGAQSYMVFLTDDKGRTKKAETGGLHYDFRPYMQREGTYSFRVRPVSTTGKTGVWCDAGGFVTTGEMATQHKVMFAVEKEIVYQDGIKTPDREIVTYRNTGWQEDENGRFWFRNEDASYPQMTWLQLGDNWYFFDRNGYLKNNEYLTCGKRDYYLTDDGKMLMNATAPDGRVAGADGKLEKQ